MRVFVSRSLRSFLLLCALGVVFCQAQAPAATHLPLTPEQQTLFDAARQDFGNAHWPDAAMKFSQLHAGVPANSTITKFDAESQVNAGQTTLALTLLQPLLTADSGDVQALAIAAHAYAQAKQSPERDAALAHLQQLHDDHATKLQPLLVESDPLPDGGSLRIFYFFEPWSRFHITLLACVFDGAGKQIRRIALESDDIDQVSFAKEHPADAAKGDRRYSIDSYTDQVTNGTNTQTEALFGFFDGRPTYDTFRDRALRIAQNKNGPVSTTTVPQPVPKP